jgi:competence protein ComEC
VAADLVEQAGAGPLLRPATAVGRLEEIRLTRPATAASFAMRDPLPGPVAAIAAGILAARFVPFRGSELMLIIGAFLALGIVAIVRRARVLAGICCWLGLIAAGALTALVHRPGPAPELDVVGREVVILSGCVVEPPALSGERERFLLELEPHARVQVTLYAKPDEALPALAYGSVIELDARVRSPRNYENPGAFDYRRYLARHDIYWTASSAARTVRLLPGRCGSPFQKAVMDLRAAAMARINALYGRDPYQAAMMQAVLLGQQFQMQKVWTGDYRSTGTFHTLVISGTHVAIVAAFVFFVLRVCFVPATLAGALTAAVAWLYALVTGFNAPCVRSAAALTLVIAAGYFFRERRPLNLLAAVALGFLLFDPDQLFDASFQLSFLAVAFLGVFATPLIRATSGPLARGLADLANRDRDIHLEPRVAQFRIEMRLLAETLHGVLKLPLVAARRGVVVVARVLFFLYQITAVSAVIQAGLALPMIVYFHRVGLSGLTANALVVPLMGLAIPVGFLAVFTGWAWVARIGGVLLALSRTIVHWHATLDPDWRIPTPPLWLGIAFSLALIAAAMARGRWWRVASGAAVAALLALLLWQPFPPDVHPGELELAVIDVGQGDGLLLIFPDGRRMILDGGGIPSFGSSSKSQLDVGEDVVAPYLWDRNIRNVDVVALSHAHDDHIGGLPALVSDFRPRELWTGATPESPAWRILRDRAVHLGVKIVPMLAPRHFAWGGAQIEILAPFADYVPAGEPTNDDSLVMRVRYGKHSFLLCGDAERPIEYRMLSENELQPDDVLKVGHHGSHTSSTQAFLDAVRPVFAIVSVGQDNSYGHPHADVIDRLLDHNAVVYRTDLDGLVSIRTDGRRFHIGTWRDLAPALGPMPGYGE